MALFLFVGDDFNPRESEVNNHGSNEFGDFESAFGELAGSNRDKNKKTEDEFADFSTAFAAVSPPTALPVLYQQPVQPAAVVSNTDLLSGLDAFSSLSVGQPQHQHGPVGSLLTSPLDTGKTVLVGMMDEVWQRTSLLLDTLSTVSRLMSDSEVSRVCLDLGLVCELLPGPLTAERLAGVDVEVSSWRTYVDTCYGRLLHELVRLFDCRFPWCGVGRLQPAVARVFTIDHRLFYCESLDVLLLGLAGGGAGDGDALAALLALLLNSDGLLDVLVRGGYTRTSPLELGEMDETSRLLQRLVSVPARVSNRLLARTPLTLRPSHVGRLFLLQLVRALTALSDLRVTCTTARPLLALYLGKILTHYRATLNHQDQVDIVAIVELLCESEPGAVLVHEMFTSLEERYVETVLLMFLREGRAGGASTVRTLGPVVHRSTYWRYLLGTKLPLLHQARHTDTFFVRNLAACLVTEPRLCVETVKGVLAAWSAGTAGPPAPLPQQLYMAGLMLCVAPRLRSLLLLLGDDETREQLMSSLVRAVPVRLACPDPTGRAAAMLAAEHLTAVLQRDHNLQLQLRFDYDGFPPHVKQTLAELTRLQTHEENTCTGTSTLDQLCRRLYLRCNPTSPGDDAVMVTVTTTQAPSATRYIVPHQNTSTATTGAADDSLITIIDGEGFELDSDDDLEPYGEEVAAGTGAGAEAPRYLRDLRDLLADPPDPATFTACMDSAEQLIEEQLDRDDVSLALELLELLLALQMSYHYERFEVVVFSCCVRITCTFPQQCAQLLCQQFHCQPTMYTVAQRLLVLNVLAESARALSSFVRSDPRPPDHVQTSPPIGRNTRRFFSSCPLSATSSNRFSAVCGWYFFPLVCARPRYDTDHILLERLLITLAEVVRCAGMAASRMSADSVRLWLAVRGHREPRVDRAALMLLTAALLTPNTLPCNDMLPELLEARAYLEHTTHPPDMQDLVSAALALLHRALHVPLTS